MVTGVSVKICGLTSPDVARAAAQAGARFVGLVFFERSPRHVSLAQAREIALAVPEGVAKVALTVDASDEDLSAMLEQVPIDLLQLHGRETPDRVAYIRDRFGLPVMKAIGVAEEQDLDAIARYATVSDMLLIDAKPPKGAVLPGGNGLAFDWRLLAGRRWPVPWMLAGGLTPETVASAVALTGARQVDVSSGVESAPGIKDAARIQAFVTAAQQTASAPPSLK